MTEKEKQDRQKWADAFMEDVKIFMDEHGFTCRGKCGIGPSSLISVAEVGRMTISVDLPFSGFFGYAAFSSRPTNGRKKSARRSGQGRREHPDSLKERKP